MNGEETYLISELNGCLGELKALINTKNEGKRRVQRALSTYDGDGKLFEALTLFRLKLLFDEYGIETRICQSDGSSSSSFVLRGAPGKLTRERFDERELANPGYIEIRLQDGPVELHNSVEWPDRLVGYGVVHELDISIAETSACNALASWYGLDLREKSRLSPEHVPLFGMEIKFHQDVATKALGREMTGLSYTTCPMMFVLGTSAPATKVVSAQIASLPRMSRRGVRASRCISLWDYDEKRSRLWPANFVGHFIELWTKRLRERRRATDREHREAVEKV
ncbi:hypothetical protein ACC668_33110 [Rhizobium ruizarguesonis]